MEPSDALRRGRARGALGALILLVALSLQAQPSANDMIVEHFYPPELLKQCDRLLNLTDEQKAFLQTEQQQAQERVASLQAQVRKEAEALVPLVTPERVDEEKVLAQSEKIRRLESDIKRAQFALLIRVKNKLTPEQQARLKAVLAKNAIIQQKLLKAEDLARQRQKEGRNLTVLEPLRAEFEGRMRDGELQEAEVVLDRTLRILESLK